VKCVRKTQPSWTENDVQMAIRVFWEGRDQLHAAELIAVPVSCLHYDLDGPLRYKEGRIKQSD